MPVSEKKTTIILPPGKPTIERPKLLVDVDRRNFLRNGMISAPSDSAHRLRHQR